MNMEYLLRGRKRRFQCADCDFIFDYSGLDAEERHLVICPKCGSNAVDDMKKYGIPQTTDGNEIE